MHPVASLLAAAHLDDLVREAESERRARIVRGGQASRWSAIVAAAAGRIRAMTDRSGGRPTSTFIGASTAEA